MKNILTLLSAILLVSSCQQRTTSGRELTVSIEPLRYFVEQIAGNSWDVKTLVPNGSSPETYEPTPYQLVNLVDSKAYFSVGNLGFERTWLSKIQDNAPAIRVINTSEGVTLLHDEDAHAHQHNGDGYDPHTWTSPANAKLLSTNICRELCQLDPNNANVYTANLRRFLLRIEQLHKRIKQELAQTTSRSFVIYHPALVYFARDYALKQLALEEGGKEPAPNGLRMLIEEAREERVKVVFVQKEFKSANATTLAKEIKAQIVTINPLSYHWEEELLRIANALNHGK